MMLAKDKLGLKGEAIAARYLLSLGWRVLERRWRCGSGDIDLVAEDRGEVVFVEVKSRADEEFGPPEEAVTPAKRRQLRSLSAVYMASRPASELYRIDVIAVIFDAGKPRLRHMRSAVGAEED